MQLSNLPRAHNEAKPELSNNKAIFKKKKKKVNHVKEPVSQKSGKELTRGNLISINTWQIPQRR